MARGPTAPSPKSTTPMVSSKAVLPRLGLGMAALGRPGYINLDRASILGSDRDAGTMQRQANTVMDSLFATGEAVWLDCARSYGLSEEFVGEYLRAKNVRPEEVYVSSKWGYTYVADWNVVLGKGEPHEVKDHSVENFLKQVEETAGFLGEYVNLYQVHSATFESGILSDSRAYEALRKCRADRGWALGLSVSGPNQNDVLRAAMKLKLFDSVQCTFNVLEQRAKDALQEAHDAGMDIIVKEGLANGRALQHPSILKYAQQLGCEPDQLALGCILAQPFEPRVLSGAVTAKQLESNFKALEVCRRLVGDPDLLSEIMNSCVMSSEEYWNDRSALAWN